LVRAVITIILNHVKQQRQRKRNRQQPRFDILLLMLNIPNFISTRLWFIEYKITINMTVACLFVLDRTPRRYHISATTTDMLFSRCTRICCKCTHISVSYETLKSKLSVCKVSQL